jgi:Transposase, Mutator family/CRISPR-associated protein (Cas_Cas5)
LRPPHWPLALGRKAFVPAQPVWLDDAPFHGLHPGTLTNALSEQPRIAPTRREHRDQPTRVLLEHKHEGALRHDQPTGPFVGRKFGPRYPVFRVLAHVPEPTATEPRDPSARRDLASAYVAHVVQHALHGQRNLNLRGRHRAQRALRVRLHLGGSFGCLRGNPHARACGSKEPPPQLTRSTTSGTSPLVRNSLDYASWKDRKALAAAIKPFYTAPSAEAAQAELQAFERSPWGTKFPTVAAAWRRAWDKVIPSFAFPPEVRKVIYTTNAIESVNARLRKIIKTRGHFPSDDAATKLIWLALRIITADWGRPANTWTMTMNQFAILYEERFTQPTAAPDEGGLNHEYMAQPGRLRRPGRGLKPQ